MNEKDRELMDGMAEQCRYARERAELAEERYKNSQERLAATRAELDRIRSQYRGLEARLRECEDRNAGLYTACVDRARKMQDLQVAVRDLRRERDALLCAEPALAAEAAQAEDRAREIAQALVAAKRPLMDALGHGDFHPSRFGIDELVAWVVRELDGARAKRAKAGERWQSAMDQLGKMRDAKNAQIRRAERAEAEVRVLRQALARIDSGEGDLVY